MWKKLENYYWTLKYLKKSQLFYLVKHRLEHAQRARTKGDSPKTDELPLWIHRMDAHPEYISRFCADEILAGQVTLLHESGKPGGKNWKEPKKSHLWNFNLHYLEYLLPLAAAYQKERDAAYYTCFRELCRKWIQDNQEGTGDGWHPYTISLRLTNLWICMDGFGAVFEKDHAFAQELKDSMYAQYVHLQKKQELHLLGNHYFENLKTVLLGSLYFREPDIYNQYKRKLQKELQEQILSDGVHYERSLMYHKIILEDLMRVAKAVRQPDPSFYGELTDILQKMTDALWSLERDMGRTLLFNDAGDNVAKPMDSLLNGLGAEFAIFPKQEGQRAFPDAGYYCLGNDRIRLVLDAGEIAPPYMPGHGHCDGLSFELALNGKPLFVNSGTGQYQGPLRSYFRSTRAHNTVVVDGEEQSMCWGEHRVGKRMRAVSGALGHDWVGGKLTACTGKRHARRIGLREDMVVIRDRIKGHGAGYLHLAPEYAYRLQGQSVLVMDQKGKHVCSIQMQPEDRIQIHREGELCQYAPEFGRTEQIQVLEFLWEGDGTEHEIKIRFL